MAIADGACAARSRREEEDDALLSSTTTNEEIARNPRLPNGLRARVRTQTLSCADEHLRYIQFDLWAQQLSCYFGIDHLGPIAVAGVFGRTVVAGRFRQFNPRISCCQRRLQGVSKKERLARHFRGVRRQARMLPEPSCFAVSQNYVSYRHLG